MAYEQYANNAQTTTTGSINNSSNPVTFSVTSATNFPTTGNFRIIVDSEIMLVTSVSGTSFTASRAQEGTSIASHSSGATVTQILTAASLQQLVTDRTLVGTFASLPAAGVAGRTYECTDNGYYGIDNGTSWSWWYHGHPVTIPESTGWSWFNQGNATVSQTTGALVLQNQTSNGGADKWNVYARAVPGSTPYTLEWGFYLYYPLNATNNSCLGPCLIDSTGNKSVFWRFAYGSATGTTIFYSYCSNMSGGGGFSNTQGGFTQGYNGLNPVWVRMNDDGTHRNWYIGANQQNLILIYQESRTNNITATDYGLGVDAYSSAIGAELFHLAGG